MSTGNGWEGRCRWVSVGARWRSGRATSASQCIPGPTSLVSASSCPASGMVCPRGDNRPRWEVVAVQIPVGEVERRSLDVYELAAGGAR